MSKTLRGFHAPEQKYSNRYREFTVRCQTQTRCRDSEGRLSAIVLPRVRDFKGLPPNSFDGRGNYTLGLKDQLIFPEIAYEKVDKQKGMNVTIVTTAANDNQARMLLKHLGMPFRTQ